MTQIRGDLVTALVSFNALVMVMGYDDAVRITPTDASFTAETLAKLTAVNA